MKIDSIPPDMLLLQRAASLAADAHRHQLRKDGKTPYAAHTARVTLTLAHHFGYSDPVILAAGLLHDLIEDTPADYDDVLAATNREVADLVAALTKDMRLPEEQREAAYDRQLAAAPWQARLVKLADVFDNVCDSLTSGTPVKVEEKARRILALVKDDPGLAAAAAKLRQLLG